MNVVPPSDCLALAAAALQEDLNTLGHLRAFCPALLARDITAKLVAADAQAQATIICRENAVLCGKPYAQAVFAQVSDQIHSHWQVEDGQNLAAGDVLCTLQGPARALLTAERSALNVLQCLSGTATQTRDHVEALAGTKAKLCDTRKTVPGLRQAQKYAVRCGGGLNHRMGLDDAFLIKENHIIATGGISQAMAAARALAPGQAVIVEVETLNECQSALQAQAEVVLLDNFGIDAIRQAVAMKAKMGAKSLLEASGGVDLSDLRRIAQCGIDRISVGALTKHLQAVDFSMRFLSA